MTCGVYLAARDPGGTKAMVALGLAELLVRETGSVGVFRPVIRAGEPDRLVETLRSRFGSPAPYADCVGVAYEDVHADAEKAIEVVLDRYGRLARGHTAIVVVGTDHSGVGLGTELAFNARLAAHLGLPVVLAVNGLNRSAAEIAEAVASARRELAGEHAAELATIVTRCSRAVPCGEGPPVFAIPETPALTDPTVADLMAGCDGRLVLGGGHRLGGAVRDLMVGAMSLPSILDRLTGGAVVIVPAEHAAAVLPGLFAAHRSPAFPALAGVVLTGAELLSGPLLRLLISMDEPLPVIATDADTFATATRLAAVRGQFSPAATGKIETALGLFAAHVDGSVLARRLHMDRPSVVTPQMFGHGLIERARVDRRRVVLPESGDERVLRAADILLRRRAADLILLGDAARIHAHAARLGLDLAAAEILDPAEPVLRARCARKYAELRAHKGMTYELAYDAVTDASYAGTLLVRLGLADGMVSGAAHPTASTLRPAFEIIKAAPGGAVVSSVFLMCLADRVLVFGDCAVNPTPDAARLAAIAVASAATAELFGITPRVAMLSYSTGASGAGQDVEKVRQATGLVRAARPGLLVEGPIQYDAALDPGVAAAKLPGSQVAGRATVLVVPDLNTGNVLYKAVQRSAGAMAIGPVLQGLAHPVNDLSRGATVEDIVSTVAVTAVQAAQATRFTPKP
ncbi:phosphate acetyltransferase [Actinomadura fulvescens]|uniref:Phosphate acetyltransferase n=1 Tax=Actinomadura fulvescens TaxID=46160 RepID=A0ABP6C8Q2_9ACTN